MARLDPFDARRRGRRRRAPARRRFARRRRSNRAGCGRRAPAGRAGRSRTPPAPRRPWCARRPTAGTSDRTRSRASDGVAVGEVIDIGLAPGRVGCRAAASGRRSPDSRDRARRRPAPRRSRARRSRACGPGSSSPPPRCSRRSWSGSRDSWCACRSARFSATDLARPADRGCRHRAREAAPCSPPRSGNRRRIRRAAAHCSAAARSRRRCRLAARPPPARRGRTPRASKNTPRDRPSDG